MQWENNKIKQKRTYVITNVEEGEGGGQQPEGNYSKHK